MNQIQAIETFYGGNRYRSRIEARWAVFMDCLQVPFLYEPEGYEAGGLRYLPDFFLPDADCFLEIKPTPEAFNEQARRKVKMLAEGTRKPVYVFAGECALTEWSWDTTEHANGAYGFNSPLVARDCCEHSRAFFFCCCALCEQVQIARGYSQCSECGHVLDLESHLNPVNTQAAFAVARAIRFDHRTAPSLTAKAVRELWNTTMGFCRGDCYLNPMAVLSEAASIVRFYEETEDIRNAG